MDSIDERAALAARLIPTMTLSTSQNSLTAPLEPLKESPEENATARFRVTGNAIITGGAGALGLAATRALLEHGLTSVAVFDLPSTFKSSDADIAQMRSEFPSRKIFTVPVDVTSPENVESATQEAVEKMGGVDILCCFAGIVGCVPSISVSASQFQKVMDVNLLGSFLCAQATAKAMIRSGKGGSILFTASISAHHTNFPQPQVAYNVSKAAVTHLTRNLAAEWAAHGIRVNSISPGYLDTVLNAGDNLKEIRDIWASRCPMGRMGDVQELTGAVVLLCSRFAGRYISGADLLIDGAAMSL